MATSKIELSRHPFLLAKAIRITKLNRRRRIWAFLPSDYFQNQTKRYPVIYFNDGQNVFEGWKAAFGKGWDTHITMQKNAIVDIDQCILVGIEHGKKYRKGEYTPFDHSDQLSFEGNAYSDFVANELKHYVDKTLRTRPEREYNAIVGSSLGGLNALYVGFKHQDVFSKVGVFSPSLWAAPMILPLIERVGKHYSTKFYLSVGSKEGRYTVDHVHRLNKTLLFAGFASTDIKLNVVENSYHNETLWKSEFSNFYRWISLNV
jgi:predicted alpha/beta superfamily hydrolase